MDFESVPKVVTRMRVKMHIMFWFRDWTIACVIGSAAVLLEGMMKPSFLQVARFGRLAMVNGKGTDLVFVLEC